MFKFWNVVGVFFITAALILSEIYNTLLPKVVVVFAMYLIFAWIRVTRWWNVVFDFLLIGYALLSTIFFDRIPDNMKDTALIVYMVIGGAYFLTTLITKSLGYPIVKENYKS